MKRVRSNWAQAALWVSLTLGALTHVVGAAEPTAFALAREGNRYVGEQAKDQVIQIRSEKSVASTVPTIWYVVYYDPTATFKAVEVKFGAGKMLEVKRPMKLLEPITGTPQPLDLSKLKLDSHQAIDLVLKEPLLEKLTVQATSAKLERGDANVPVWKIRVWAAKLRNPKEQADLGDMIIAAEDGKIIKNNLQIRRVD